MKPEVLIPGHGPVIFGEARAAQMPRDGAEALEYLTGETLKLMNEGATLDQVLHAVKVPSRYLETPYLRPKYDDPEFLVHAVYHFYAGWFDGNPAHLKPARDVDLASELAILAGGADKLAERAGTLAREGQTRLAAHLSELASLAAPESKRIQSIRATVLSTCIDTESSVMAKASYTVYLRDAETRSKG
jgi:alkyl sulfatase BDS1-like metallo-beta-lactamase superfamily hydrolase